MDMILHGNVTSARHSHAEVARPSWGIIGMQRMLVRVTFESIITTGNGQAGNFTEMHNHNCFYIETFMTCNSFAFHVFLS
ncbi:Uncharacterized protein HZ326_0841 [Fusarium oxysporum f. sp. albedinis]|nr:Uncharacterized protein HZ326_0841 [Fusarium oxysporum f. sp. albedinis]